MAAIQGDVYHIDSSHKIIKGYDKNSVVNCFYAESWTTMGGNYIQVVTNPSFSDKDQSYYAGYIEGFVSNVLISWWLTNNSILCAGTGCDMPSDSSIKYAKDNLKWCMEQSKNNQNDPWWYQCGLVINQLQGMTDGYMSSKPKDPTDSTRSLTATLDDFYINTLAAADLDDIPCIACAPYGSCFEDCAYIYLPDPDPSKPVKPKMKKPKHYPPFYSKCSAVVKFANDKSDLYVGHGTWDDYNAMIKLYRYYNFPFHKSANDKTVIPAPGSGFSGFPGVLVSGDDFYITSQGLAMISSEIGPAPNTSIYVNQGYTPQNSRMSALRLIIGLRLSENIPQLANILYVQDSGTGNNDWLVVDYKKFTPGKDLPNDTVWYFGSYPKMIKTYDVTSTMNSQKYLGLYNIPMDADLYSYGGWPGSNATEAIADGKSTGDWDAQQIMDLYSYEHNPRANIVRALNNSVNNLDDFKNLVRYNDYSDDCYNSNYGTTTGTPTCLAIGPGGANPWNAMLSRADLVPSVDPDGNTSDFPADESANCFGGIDSKVVNKDLIKIMQYWTITSPAYGGPSNLPPLTMSDSNGACTIDDVPIQQVVDTWNFPWYLHKWTIPLPSKDNGGGGGGFCRLLFITFGIALLILFGVNFYQRIKYPEIYGSFRINPWLIVGTLLLIVILLVFCWMKKSSSTHPTPPDKNCILKQRVLETTASKKILNIPPRRMWGWGLVSPDELGYCGEAALQCVMIYYGNYISQEQVYKAAGNQTFLIGTNDPQVAKTFHMKMDTPNWDTKDSVEKLLAYVKKFLNMNIPVLLGVFTHETLTPESDPAFDHTVPVYGYDLGADGHMDTLHYLDMYQMSSDVTFDCSVNKTTKIPKCYQNRKQCSGTVPYPMDNCIPNILKTKDASFNTCVILGNEDPFNELFPVMLQMSLKDEPDWGIEDFVNAKPIPMACSVIAGCLVKGDKYTILRFDNPMDIPVGKFLESGKFTMRHDFVANSDSHILIVHDDPKGLRFMTNGTYFFRCVANTSDIVSKFPPNVNRCDISQGKPMQPVPVSSLLYKLYVRQQRRMMRNKVKAMNNKVSVHASASLCNATPVNPGISCYDTDDGADINTNWVWNFPNNPELGCIPVTFAVNDPEPKNIPTCVTFSVTGLQGQTGAADGSLSPMGPVDANGCVGLDGKLYIGNDNSFQTMAWQMSFEDGAFNMKSADGVTVSVLTPVK